MSRVDFTAIKARVTYNDVLRFLDLHGKKVGEQWRGSCPACGSDNDRALVLTAGRGAYCHAAKGGGDVIWLVSHVRGIGVKEAAQQLADEFGIVPQEPAAPVFPPSSNEKAAPAPTEGSSSFGPLTYLQYEHEAVQGLGLAAAIAENLGIGFAPKGMMRGRVVFPLYDHGVLVGYVGVAPGTDAKFPKNLNKEPR